MLPTDPISRWLPHLAPLMQATPPVLTVDWLKTVTELGAFGLLAWLVWWWVSRAGPARDGEFLKANDQTRAEFLASIQDARRDYLESEKRLWDVHIAAQERQRQDYLAASRELAKEHWQQLEAQRDSYERRAAADREAVDKRAEAMIRAIQGLGDVIIGKEAKNLPRSPGEMR
jgi:hypothetical protein